ncbi:TraR/DksA C4-type zinc finger protein [Laribacter hongkongensis]|uniref:TraR/DksA C4-type zinc finger protein n=1 Tax=Laribacter hongkongensis TaxID=168471 RepID=UPI001EFE2056|nr:TraR/DksA C4-type zinc finger protein [Laribacter hongkongensis]MCG8991461.1 TraR/DksA C4-type zinc finger protein [Laribacter hongkongensis]MCG8997717.1 TraR/DksA C4-type zinc finger protein [Laribacter hongkongensis]MCG9001257.1 TraR/DksA C4-type zinc finger protein [Laribacter hongkongensis]MCG9003047.1 TraR/DksA C4-type zinc finger protein [Laribacter hongkongensis]MCG9007465.1 TraR/DksA C4-type zinc finger protein [Laribacter hongkongensis]
MDIADQAAEREELFREEALSHHRPQQQAQPSAEFCEMEDCGVEIPLARREAVPGCRYCIDCQERIERTKGRAGA